jgi:hypothetical protein
LKGLIIIELGFVHRTNLSFPFDGNVSVQWMNEHDRYRHFGSASRLEWICLRMALMAVTSAVAPTMAQGITIGQVDNFEDGTTQGWVEGSSAVNIATNGPAGGNDHYLPLSSGGFGGTVRLLALNDSQWLGNYAVSGVTGIEMDLKNFGPSTLPIRIAIRESTGGSNTPGYASTTAFNLVADGAWHHSVFSLTANSLTAINSPQPLATDLANVADFRLLSSAAPSTIGDAISAQIGVDNITAVPEPATMVTAIAGIGILIGWSRLGRRHRAITKCGTHDLAPKQGGLGVALSSIDL